MPEHEDANAWLDLESAHHKAFVDKWFYVKRLDDGTYIDDGHIEKYLRRRKQGESKGMYDDRKATLSPDLHLPNLFGRIEGQFMQSESELEITWETEGEEGGLGDPLNVNSRAWQLTNNTDGSGSSLTQWQSQLLHALQVYEEVYVLVQAPQTEHGPVYWQIITPDMVWDMDGVAGRLTAVKIQHEVDRRSSLRQRPVAWTQVDLYDLEGVRRWEYETSKTSKVAVEINDDAQNLPFFYDYFVQADAPDRRLPIVYSRFAFKKYVAYLMAKQAAAILNHESERNNRLRMAATPKIIHKKMGGFKTDDPVQEEARKGGNYWIIDLDEDISVMEAPVDGVTEASEVIKDERKNFYITGYQTYDEEAREITATAIRQQERGGRVAYLTLLALRFDTVINESLFLTEQVEHPGGPWGKAKAVRKGKFRPDETESEAERDLKAFFGDEKVPLTEEAFVEAVRQQYEARSLEIKDEEAFVEQMRREYKTRKMAGLVAGGVGQVEAAVLAGFEGEELSRRQQADFATNGLEQ